MVYMPAQIWFDTKHHTPYAEYNIWGGPFGHKNLPAMESIKTNKQTKCKKTLGLLNLSYIAYMGPKTTDFYHIFLMNIFLTAESCLNLIPIWVKNPCRNKKVHNLVKS